VDMSEHCVPFVVNAGYLTTDGDVPPHSERLISDDCYKARIFRR
jgi:hypothetical protein